MRYLKLYESFDDFDEDESISKKYGVENYTIESICDKYDIKGYTINDDGSIDCNHAFLKKSDLDRLPLKFRNIRYDFYCQENKLTSTEGFPISVGEDFNCGANKLTSLEGCPKFVGGNFNCTDNDIRTFEGFPINLGGDFSCFNNPVYELWVLFYDVEKVELFNDFGITDGEVVIIDRLNEFLEMIGKPWKLNPIVKDISGLRKKGYKLI